jgi:hypothetical protein
MVDAQYLAWFMEEFDYADTLTWCRTTSPEGALAVYGVTTDQTGPANLSELNEFRLVAGQVGNGTLLIQPNGCPSRSTLTALAQRGPCLSVQWSDTAPPGVTYAQDGRIVASFDPFDREAFAAPDPDSVERWITTTPAESDIWDDDWALAALMTAEALCEGTVDEEWARAAHVGVRP